MGVQIGFLGPALFLSQLSHVKTATGAVACMMASQGLDSFSQSGLYSNHQVRSISPQPVMLLSSPAFLDLCMLVSWRCLASANITSAERLLAAGNSV